MIALFNLINTLIGFYVFMLVVYVVLSWLTQFGVVNSRNRAVAMINEFLYKITEPVLRPLRRLQQRLLPTWQIDLSPLILILLLYFIRDLLTYDIPRLTGY